MRKRKFRVWNKSKGLLYYIGNETPIMELAFTAKGWVVNAWSQGGEWLEKIADSEDGDSLMEFIGLTDRNKKDIYEEDILEIVDEAGETIRVVAKWGIHRREMKSGWTVDIPGFSFVTIKGWPSFPIVDNYQGTHDLEILKKIGNTLQNPELFKK